MEVVVFLVVVFEFENVDVVIGGSVCEEVVGFVGGLRYYVYVGFVEGKVEDVLLWVVLFVLDEYFVVVVCVCEDVVVFGMCLGYVLYCVFVFNYYLLVLGIGNCLCLWWEIYFLSVLINCCDLFLILKILMVWFDE